ncbi:MAG: hypothetical protein ACI4OR_03750 [Alphaproteobacteria bacterium]
MFHKILFACVIFAFLGLGILFHHFSETTDLMKRYQKLGLVQSDFKYEKVEKTWGDQGLIFYQVKFPFINVPMESDTMTLSLNDSGMNIKLKNTHIGVTQGLKNLYGSQMAERLNTYVPYQDFFSHLLTSMAVMGVDEFVGDISVNTVYSDIKTMQFTVQMEQESSPTLEIKGVIHIPIIGAHQMSDLWNGQVESADIKVKESWLYRYVNYAKSRRTHVSDSIKNGLLKIKEKARLSPLKNILK